ncbi:hypothetical protein L873DRAFT_832967 [Choiromyces venosus 120613-1]|uniref:Uncharacterized protein n=1 Tax=Choiromyces venosus 120613-1 TaxID=1336337 RepID=A0A3N4JTK9_9PEZI|nr:hypothetical protein L873DRAFT_832967 [Choiromyces venosus 120613-1]
MEWNIKFQENAKPSPELSSLNLEITGLRRWRISGGFTVPERKKKARKIERERTMPGSTTFIQQLQYQSTVPIRFARRGNLLQYFIAANTDRPSDSEYSTGPMLRGRIIVHSTHRVHSKHSPVQYSPRQQFTYLIPEIKKPTNRLYLPYHTTL